VTSTEFEHHTFKNHLINLGVIAKERRAEAKNCGKRCSLINEM
jgi:hypothetical protein